MSLLDSLALLRPAYLLRRGLKARGVPDEKPIVINGVPVPPPRFRFYTCHDPNLTAFLENGRGVAEIITDRLAAAGAQFGDLESVLDFGCGCGRVARHWAGIPGPEIHGCDYNPELVEWCEDNLPFLRSVRNDLAPPLPYADGKFDLVYTISVFTHLSRSHQTAWMDELRRIIRPGGFLLITVHGDSFADRYLDGEQRRSYDLGESVVLYDALSGTNGCRAVYPYDYVARQLLKGFSIRSFTPSPEAPRARQDVYLAERLEDGASIA